MCRFIWADYNNEDDVIAKIIEIDNNDQLYLDIANQQYTYDNKYFNINYLISLFDKIINLPKYIIIFQSNKIYIKVL